METYRVKFITAGHMLAFRNNRVRTPVTFDHVREEELPLLKSQALRSMLHYEVQKESEIVINNDAVIEELEMNKEDEDIEIEELSETKDPSTILEKLISEEKE